MTDVFRFFKIPDKNWPNTIDKSLSCLLVVNIICDKEFL